MNINDITITNLETITAFGVNDGAYLFTLDELQNATIAQTQDTSDITGKAGRKLSTLKRNKAVTISGTNGMVSGGLMELQTGNAFEGKATEVLWVDYIKVSTTVTKNVTTYTAVGTAGAEIIALYVRNEDGTLGRKLVQNSSPTSEYEFSYNPSTRRLSFYESETEGANLIGAELVCYYNRKVNANTLSNYSDSYSGKCSLYIDAFGEDKCANIYRIQFFVPKADFSGEFSFEMGDNQTVHSFEAEALSGACGASGQLWTYTVFDTNTADAI